MSCQILRTSSQDIAESRDLVLLGQGLLGFVREEVFGQQVDRGRVEQQTGGAISTMSMSCTPSKLIHTRLHIHSVEDTNNDQTKRTVGIIGIPGNQANSLTDGGSSSECKDQ